MKIYRLRLYLYKYKLLAYGTHIITYHKFRCQEENIFLVDLYKKEFKKYAICEGTRWRRSFDRFLASEKPRFASFFRFLGRAFPLLIKRSVLSIKICKNPLDPLPRIPDPRQRARKHLRSLHERNDRHLRRCRTLQGRCRFSACRSRIRRNRDPEGYRCGMRRGMIV